jgi:hypothetical protein
MLVKIDHNLSPYLAELLTELGHDAKTANEEGLAKASDAVLLYQATIERRLLFTLDKGFADVDTYPRDTHAGIVVFEQSRGETIQRVERRVIAFARSQKQQDIVGRTVIVERTRLRFPRGRRKQSPSSRR